MPRDHSRNSLHRVRGLVSVLVVLKAAARAARWLSDQHRGACLSSASNQHGIAFVPPSPPVTRLNSLRSGVAEDLVNCAPLSTQLPSVYFIHAYAQVLAVRSDNSTNVCAFSGSYWTRLDCTHADLQNESSCLSRELLLCAMWCCPCRKSFFGGLVSTREKCERECGALPLPTPTPSTAAPRKKAKPGGVPGTKPGAPGTPLQASMRLH